MKYVVLDTNFILSCIRKKIDFVDKIKMMGLKIFVPVEVKEELASLMKNSMRKTQEEAKIANSLLNKNQFQEVNLNTKNVDNGIVILAQEHPEYIIATLDRGIQERIKNYKLIIRGQRDIELSE